MIPIPPIAAAVVIITINAAVAWPRPAAPIAAKIIPPCITVAQRFDILARHNCVRPRRTRTRWQHPGAS